MNALPHGTLTLHQPSAVYEGEVYTWRHVFTLAEGESLAVFDPNPPIGEALVPGQDYRVVASVLLPRDAHYLAADAVASSTPPAGWWRGVIRDLAWLLPARLDQNDSTSSWGQGPDKVGQPPLAEAPIIRGEVAEKTWVLIETSHGLLILNPGSVTRLAERSIGRSAATGDAIDWDPVRFDLIAIY